MEKIASIIIRTKNEEKLLGQCLTAVFNQNFKDFEVIIVDSGSTDKTLEIAGQFPVKIVKYNHGQDTFKPGKALNLGIQNSSGKYIVMLSAHCIPENNQWLEELLEDMGPEEVAGVYGNQKSTADTDNIDKLDLLLFFGPEKRIQKKGSFFYFHNANSVIRRSVWEEVQFDETIRHYEKIPWARKVINKGYVLTYTPKAAVSHWHGIHQHTMDAQRAQERAGRIVGILENGFKEKKVAGIIPAKGKIEYLGGKPLIEYTILQALSSKCLNFVAVTTDNPEIADIARNLGVQHIFIYPPELTEERVEIGDVLKYAISQFEKMEIALDIVAYISPTYPFRPNGLIDEAIGKLINGGYDSVLPVLPEYRACFIKEEGRLKRLDAGYAPSKFKNPILMGLSGLVTVSYCEAVKNGKDRLGKKIGTIEINNLLHYIDVGKAKAKEIAEILIKQI
ncbi:MAG: glycosyltransferase family 2 protein [Patescibacteria group bacterium]